MRSIPALPESLTARYDVGETLGSGAMGVVYRAVHRALDRPVALKVIRGELLDAEGRTRFLQEAKLAAKIVDPHVVLVFDSGTEGGVPFIAFELVEGPTLRAVMEAERLDASVAVTYAAHIAAGLAKAHDLGIIHRDVKPENVLITPQGDAKIADFGISRPAAADQPALTATGTILGSPLYMSPEQAGNRTLTPATDQYSLGVTLYEMLVGRPPFEGSTAEILAKHLRDPVELTADLRARVNLAAIEVLEKMLRKEPEQRYASCGEVAAALQRALSRWQGRRVSTIPTPLPRSVPALGSDARGTRASGARSASRPARESSRTVGADRRSVIGSLTSMTRSDASVLEEREPLPAAVKTALIALAMVALTVIAYWAGRYRADVPDKTGWKRGTVIGNVGSRIYHVVGVTRGKMPGRLQARVFDSEDEAQKAGYRRSERH